MKSSSVKNITVMTFCFLSMIPFAVCAAPSISSVSGTNSNGSTITIKGVGFGTKSNAAPLVWDDCSGTTITTKWSGGWPSTGTSSNLIRYTTPAALGRGVTLPHSNITKYITGAHYNGSDSNAGYNVMVWKTLPAMSYPTTIYGSAYYRVDPNWPRSSTAGVDDNMKLFDYSNGSEPYTMNTESDSNWYVDYGQSGTSIDYPSPWYETNDDGGSLTAQYYGESGTNAFTWVKQEYEVKIARDSSGYIKVWDNGTQVINYSGPTDTYTGTTKTVAFGGYARNRQAGTYDIWRTCIWIRHPSV
jgi:hypothetical protein